MNKSVMLVMACVYVIGYVGMFFTIFMDIRDIGPIGYVLGEAALRSLIWPVEVVRLFL